MKPVPFDPAKDMAPTPFDERHRLLAQRLKTLGLPFAPHVGCFVWDPHETISAASPFPDRVYFILSLPRFVDIFGSRETIAEKLVWLPTWHQARQLCEKMNIGDDRIAAAWQENPPPTPGDELLRLYGLIAEALGFTA
jgi:hypothetical protein